MEQWEWLARNARYAGDSEWNYLGFTLEQLTSGNWDVYRARELVLVSAEWDKVLEFILGGKLC